MHPAALRGETPGALLDLLQDEVLELDLILQVGRREHGMLRRFDAIGIGLGLAANRVPVRFVARGAGAVIALSGVALLVRRRVTPAVRWLSLLAVCAGGGTIVPLVMSGALKAMFMGHGLWLASLTALALRAWRIPGTPPADETSG